MTTFNDHTRGPRCQTLTGGIEYPFDPLPGDINVRDFRALANICRFGGHVTSFYSVAEHSWRCAQRAEELDLRKADQWAALVHDVHEAYGTGDIRGPMKRTRSCATRWQLECMEALNAIERRHIDAVRTVLKTPLRTPLVVREIDMELLATERRDLMVGSSVDWGSLPPPLEDRIEPQSPARAWMSFITYWNRMKPEGVVGL